jgi:hypothetical protein
LQYGHLHRVLLDLRDGGTFVTFEYSGEYREACLLRHTRNAGTAQLDVIPTDVAATPEIVLAFNQGDATFLRSNEAARTVRQALFAYLKAHEPADVRCTIIADDLRRNAASPLCS